MVLAGGGNGREGLQGHEGAYPFGRPIQPAREAPKPPHRTALCPMPELIGVLDPSAPLRRRKKRRFARAASSCHWLAQRWRGVMTASLQPAPPPLRPPPSPAPRLPNLNDAIVLCMLTRGAESRSLALAPPLRPTARRRRRRRRCRASARPLASALPSLPECRRPHACLEVFAEAARTPPRRPSGVLVEREARSGVDTSVCFSAFRECACAPCKDEAPMCPYSPPARCPTNAPLRPPYPHTSRTKF
jgi:hypothetical protein